MSPRKLNEQDKKEILILYREPDETTSTLADRYNVSSSTISRFLKNNLSEDEYEELIKQKRQSRRSSKSASPKLVDTPAETPAEISPPETPVEEDSKPSPTPKLSVAPPILQKKRSTPQQLDLADIDPQDEEDDDEDLDEVNVITLEEMLGEDMADLDEEEDDEDDDWEVAESEDILEEDSPKDRPKTRSKNTEVKVLPLEEATFPKTCYLVIDRSAELITKPLKDFADLGNIPIEESRQETLPVFDNHRVARRFSHRSQRVIKVPDSSMLEKTCSYLKAKGITRLLLDGQVFSLPPS